MLEKEKEIRKLFPHLVDYKMPGEATDKAIETAEKATEEDHNKNYAEAAKLYEQAVQHYLHALRYDPMSDESKANFRSKCKNYLDRAQKLKCMDQTENLIEYEKKYVAEEAEEIRENAACKNTLRMAFCSILTRINGFFSRVSSWVRKIVSLFSMSETFHVSDKWCA